MHKKIYIYCSVQWLIPHIRMLRSQPKVVSRWLKVERRDWKRDMRSKHYVATLFAQQLTTGSCLDAIQNLFVGRCFFFTKNPGIPPNETCDIIFGTRFLEMFLVDVVKKATRKIHGMAVRSPPKTSETLLVFLVAFRKRINPRSSSSCLMVRNSNTSSCLGDFCREGWRLLETDIFYTFFSHGNNFFVCATFLMTIS